MQNETKEPAIISRLEKLGFKQASATVKMLALRKRKMAVAYEFYRFVRPEKIEQFNRKLALKRRDDGYTQQLGFTSVQDYAEVPPDDVLDKMAEAVGRQCFDSFEVAHLVLKAPDPILFGRIEGCTDRFFIAQWDADVRIEDILQPHEG